MEASATCIPGRCATSPDRPGPPDQDRIDICPRRRRLPGPGGGPQRDRQILAASGDVVVGVDVSAPSSALRAAFTEAELRQTGLLVVHAWRPKRTSLFVDGPAEEDEFRRQFGVAHQSLVEYVCREASRHPHVPVRNRLFTLPPADSLVLAASAGQVLILGRHRRGHFDAAGLGQVARRCLAGAPSPVLITSEIQSPERPAAVVSSQGGYSRSGDLECPCP